MANAPFYIVPQLTAIAMAYKNKAFIADSVLPRVPVSKQEFRYTLYNLADSFSIPNTLVGRLSKPNQVTWGATSDTDSTVDYALDAPIPNADTENAAGTNINPEGRSTELITDLVQLDREKRVADLVFNVANYTNKTTLAGVTQWSDATSDPIGTIMKALDTVIVRPNVLVLGRSVLTALLVHPKVVSAALGNSGVSGVASKGFLANLFELDEVVVGEGYYNSAKPGQTPTLVRLWGKHAAFIYRNPLIATTTDQVSFGITAQWGTRISGRLIDPDVGMRGGVRVRVGESVKELLLANDVAYFFQNAIA